MKTQFSKIIWILVFVIFYNCSDNEPISDIVKVDDPLVNDMRGTVVIDFSFNNNNGCGERLELFISESELGILYGEDYLLSPNVYDNKQFYEYKLEEGKYYYYVSVICMCDDWTCNRSGYGGDPKIKIEWNSFEIIKDQTTRITTFSGY